MKDPRHPPPSPTSRCGQKGLGTLGGRLLHQRCAVLHLSTLHGNAPHGAPGDLLVFFGLLHWTERLQNKKKNGHGNGGWEKSHAGTSDVLGYLIGTYWDFNWGSRNDGVRLLDPFAKFKGHAARSSIGNFYVTEILAMVTPHLWKFRFGEFPTRSGTKNEARSSNRHSDWIPRKGLQVGDAPTAIRLQRNTIWSTVGGGVAFMS